MSNNVVGENSRRWLQREMLLVKTPNNDWEGECRWGKHQTMAGREVPGPKLLLSVCLASQIDFPTTTKGGLT